MARDLSINHKSLLALALPFMASSVTQPLLGAVDTAVIGRLDDASYIGGVALGAVIFNTLYWVFGFLRVSTSGFSAQSLGSPNEADKYCSYFRPLLISIVLSLTFVVLQGPIIDLALWTYNPDPAVVPHVITYFDIVIWGAPLVLTGYVNLGWLMGRSLVRESVLLQVSANVLNIVLDLLFVLVFEMGVAGVAWATLIAQLSGCVLGFYIIARRLEFAKALAFKADLLNRAALKKIMGVNSDLMIRTCCLLTMINMFMAKSSDLGVEVLAANAVLFQMHYILAYFFDGLAAATNIFAGKSAKQQNLDDFKQTIHLTTIHTVVMGLVLGLVVFLFNDSLLKLFTNLEDVISRCKLFVNWVALYPLVTGVSLAYYGFYTGATYTGPVRNSLLLALLVFLAAYFGFIPLMGNHGLWLAFILFSLVRSLVLFQQKNRLMRAVFSPEAV